MDLDNKLALIWITDMIANKITDRITDRITYKITDKITNMTSKLQMLITFATVARLRPTIYQNAQNWEENPWANSQRGFGHTIFPKNASNCLNFVFKDQTPKSLPNFLLFFFSVFFFATVFCFFFFLLRFFFFYQTSSY